MPSKKSAPPAPRDTWLRPNLRVRLIDEDSKYYNTKVRVEDVVSPYSCVVRTESGRVLDDVGPRYAHTTNRVDFYAFKLSEWIFARSLKMWLIFAKRVCY